MYITKSEQKSLLPWPSTRVKKIVYKQIYNKQYCPAADIPSNRIRVDHIGSRLVKFFNCYLILSCLQFNERTIIVKKRIKTTNETFIRSEFLFCEQFTEVHSIHCFRIKLFRIKTFCILYDKLNVCISV